PAHNLTTIDFTTSVLNKMDTLIPNDYVHITGGKDLNITTGIPCKITHDGYYLDNGGRNHGSYVNLNWQSYYRNYNYSRQIWFFEEMSNPRIYRISIDGNYLDTFEGENNSECRMSKKHHHDSLYYSRQLWTFLNQVISESGKVQIQNISNKCYLDTWGQYSTVRFYSYFTKPDKDFYSSQLWKFEIADYKLKADTENFKYDKKITDLDSYATKVPFIIFDSRNRDIFLDKLDVDIKAEYVGVKGNLPEIIEWDNKNTSLETIKKVQLDEINISGKYLTKIKGFSDRLRKDGSIATMEQVDINVVLCFLRNSGFEGTYFGTKGKEFELKLPVMPIFKVP
ncbi:10591_t:CDS:2, partial [Cetraspora pellucida]